MESITDTNPYSTPAHGSVDLPPENPWVLFQRIVIRRFLILNGILITIPILILLLAYLSFQFARAWETARNLGDPVVIQHNFWFAIDSILLIAYVFIPNGLLAVISLAWLLLNPRIRPDKW